MSSTPCLILLPGMDGTGELFSPFLAALGDDYPVQVVRYPTQTPLDYSSLEEIVRRSLPSDAPYVLLGESFSGPLAVAIAASQPSGLCGVILCCSFVSPPHSIPHAIKALLPLLPISLIPWKIAGRILLGRFGRPDILALFQQALTGVSPEVLRVRIKAALEIDVSEKLTAITVPLLYLKATEDHLVPSAAAERIKAFHPDTHIVEIEAPHFLLQCTPQQAGQHIRDFLDTLPD